MDMSHVPHLVSVSCCLGRSIEPVQVKFLCSIS